MVKVVKQAPNVLHESALGTFRFGAQRGASPRPTSTAQTQEEDHATWEAEVKRREAREKIAVPVSALRPTAGSGGVIYTPGGISYVPMVTTPKAAQTDMTGLPNSFDLHIELKPDGWWKVTAPTVHAGLFVSNKDLLTALVEAPGLLAQIVRLDGVQVKTRRGRSK